jgi:HEAT repeat protein
VQAALAGEPEAAKRLLDPSLSAKVPPQTLAKALVPAGPTAVPTLRALLKNGAAPVRMEAALALGRMNALDAIPDLKALMNDPEAQSFAAVALARLGDADAEKIVQHMLQSPVFDVRLLAAQAYEGKGQGPWVQALMPALQDPNGLTRIRAAELLAPVAPEAARPVLAEAANDPNPVVRADVTRVMEKTGLLSPTVQQTDPSKRLDERFTLASLRRLLRDADPAVRLHAAGAILDMAHISK